MQRLLLQESEISIWENKQCNAVVLKHEHKTMWFNLKFKYIFFTTWSKRILNRKVYDYSASLDHVMKRESPEQDETVTA